MEELTGTLVVVHPELTTDPVERQGQIGIIALADLDKDLITVGFGGSPLGKYSSDALLLLKPKQELYLDIMSKVKEMDVETFKTLLEINMKQEYPTHKNISDALQLAISNPQVMEYSMISLEDHLSISREQSSDLEKNESVSR